jgi:nucleoside-diphosphate-sugar epimerase
MRIFVTGATGFVGSYVVEDLIARHHEVAVLLRSTSNPWRLKSILGRLRIVTGSLDEIERLRRPLQDFRAECVLHLAWQGVANVDRNSPVQARNICHTLELAALSAELGAKSFIGAGSQAEYGPYPRAITEADPARPTTLYGRAKLAAGEMTAQMLQDWQVRFAWLRIFSTYGPKDADHWLIPSMIKTLRNKRHMSLTACEQTWGFLFASDVAAAFLTVAENPTASGIYNVGDPDAPPLRETVTMLRDLIDPGAPLGFGEVPYRPDQVMVLQAKIDRLLALGWTPKVPLQLGLRKTVEWYDALQTA